jgi:hypothetical protein
MALHTWLRIPICTPHLCLCAFVPELLSKYRSESILVLQAPSRALACRCRS